MRCQNSLGAFYRKMRYKLGHRVALTANAHKLARIIYAMIYNRKKYDPSYLQKQDQIIHVKTLHKLQRHAIALGYILIPDKTPKLIPKLEPASY